MEFPFPPDRIEWRAWLCPILFAGAVLFAAAFLARRRTAGRLSGFVALGIATVWFLLMLPRFQGAGEAARRTNCKNNLKAIGLAIHNWHDAHERLPPPVTIEPDSAPVTWRITLLPHLEFQTLASGYDSQLKWDDSHNLPIALREPMPYVCPTNPVPGDKQGHYFTAYALVTGDGSLFPDTGPLQLTEAQDGASQTLLIGEVCGRRIIWTEPRDVGIASESVDINGPGTELDASASLLSSYHIGGSHVTFADGSVRFLNQTLDTSVLRALTTANGGDKADEY